VSDVGDTVWKTLLGRSNNKCQFVPHPDDSDWEDGGQPCEHRLTDPKWERVRARICHIRGRNPGSARYIEGLPDEMVNGYYNLLLMCPNHHTMIDDLNPSLYTIEYLEGLKVRMDTAYEAGQNTKGPEFDFPGYLDALATNLQAITETLDAVGTLPAIHPATEAQAGVAEAQATAFGAAASDDYVPGGHPTSFNFPPEGVDTGSPPTPARPSTGGYGGAAYGTSAFGGGPTGAAPSGPPSQNGPSGSSANLNLSAGMVPPNRVGDANLNISAEVDAESRVKAVVDGGKANDEFQAVIEAGDATADFDGVIDGGDANEEPIEPGGLGDHSRMVDKNGWGPDESGALRPDTYPDSSHRPLG
jgi:hypothetical protein